MRLAAQKNLAVLLAVLAAACGTALLWQHLGERKDQEERQPGPSRPEAAFADSVSDGPAMPLPGAERAAELLQAEPSAEPEAVPFPPELVPEFAGDYTAGARDPPSGTVQDRLEQYGELVRQRLAGDFKRAGLEYPPEELTLVGLKDEEMLQVYARNSREEPFQLLKTYGIHAASGGPGPKLREGDRQVPEGLYEIELLNPNSLFHLSLRISYPSREDRQIAEQEGRGNLGGDIMIHGDALSIGCLAMGDKAAEDLFVLAAETGIENIRVILAPWDLRLYEAPDDPSLPDWMSRRYSEIETALQELPLPAPLTAAGHTEPGE